MIHSAHKRLEQMQDKKFNRGSVFYFNNFVELR